MQKKKTTIKDIAAKAKVSKSTVSRVINNSRSVNDRKRKAVVAAMKKLNFEPNQLARSLAGGRSMTVGVVTQDIGSPFYDSVAQGISKFLRKTPYWPIFVDGRWNARAESAAVETLLGRRVDGIILIGGDIPPERLEEISEDKAVVVVARQLSGWDHKNIFLDNFKGAYEATKYLIDSGHDRVAFISGIASHQDATRRLNGYMAALSDAGIGFDEQLVVEGDFRASSGVMAAEALLTSGVRFSAIFASNDEMAMGARLLLYRRGIRVPEDISLVGFDDQQSSVYMTPPLTTVRQPAFELGLAAAESLICQLNGEKFDLPELEVKLIVRESVSRR